MNTKTFGADLLCDGNQEGGMITISDDLFYWFPVLGGTPIKSPIVEVSSYLKNGTTLVIYVNGLPEPYTFYTWKAQAIIDAIKIRNPYFKEVPKEGTTTLKMFDTLFQIVGVLGLIGLTGLIGFIGFIVISLLLSLVR